MGGMTPNLDFLWKAAKGSISLGGLNMSWDLTEGLTKEQFLRRFERQNGGHPMIITKSGRIIIPSMNIL